MKASTKKIIDRFTDLPVSRERKRQLRQVAAGQCRVANCGEPIAMNENCLRHAIAMREQQRARNGYVRRNNSKSYRMANGGGK